MRRQTVGKAARIVHAGARAFHPLVGMQEKDRDGEFIIMSFAVFFPSQGRRFSTSQDQEFPGFKYRR